MGIQTQQSNVEVVSTGKRYTGLCGMLVKSINPTMDEMKSLGQNPNKEPEYTTNEFVEAKDGVEAYNYAKTRVDFNLYNPQHKFGAKLAFWVEDRPRWNKDHTKVEWINKFGVTAWTQSDHITNNTQLTEPPNYDWFKKEGARPALGGEGKLVTFIKAWANVPNDAQATLDNIQALAQGNVAELRGILSAIPTNEVLVLVGIKKVNQNGTDRYFQAVYDGYFDRIYKKDFNAWKSALAGQYGKFDADYQNDLTFREYTGTSQVEGDSPTNLDIPQEAQSQGAPKYKF